MFIPQGATHFVPYRGFFRVCNLRVYGWYGVPGKRSWIFHLHPEVMIPIDRIAVDATHFYRDSIHHLYKKSSDNPEDPANVWAPRSLSWLTSLYRNSELDKPKFGEFATSYPGE